MNKFLFNKIKNTNIFKEVTKTIVDNKINSTALLDLESSFKALLLASVYKEVNFSIIVITYNEFEAKELYDELLGLIDKDVLFFPAEPVHFHFIDIHSQEIPFQRIKVIDKIKKSNKKIVITSIDALIKKMPTASSIKRYFNSFYVGQKIEINNINTILQDSGYERVPQVETQGQYSIRGGIIDYFSTLEKDPIRMEFFDDEIDSIRYFDVNSQCSIDKLNKAELAPTREIVLSKKEISEAIKNIKLDIEKIKDRKHINKLDNLIEKIEEQQYNNQSILLPYTTINCVSFLDYLDDNCLCFVENPLRIKERYQVLMKEIHNDYCALLEKKEILPKHFDIFINFDEIISSIEKRKNYLFQQISKRFPILKPQKIIDASSKSITAYSNRINLFIDQIINWNKQEYKVIILVEDISDAKHVKEMLKSYEINCIINPKSFELDYEVVICIDRLKNGFELLSEKIVVVNQHEFMGKRFKKKVEKKKKKKGKVIKSFTDLKIGDYVVHDVHGIGTYMGIEQITVEGIKKDYLKIKYAKEDKLFVPVDQMDTVQTYIGIGDKAPRVNKLGSGDWNKTKSKAKKSIVDMAKELIDLYAKRQAVKGFSFSEDTLWQKEFEEKFPFQETDDQMQAIEEVKKDMMSSMPMDRLLCGDVGYGKTEVAIRAAFKAVMDSKQVAILVPTTVLAQQHYNNITNRFKNYPIKVEMLSRFRTKKQQNEIMHDLGKGRIDVIIGTHRLLSKDIKFKDLGLLIIDEEQRFGVKHKEKVKQLRMNVEVLTLSATPIPRTLHMSLIGARDMSVLDEPPQDRHPVQTYVMEYNDILIRDAIIRELTRNGQVYYVYNRVKDIDIVQQSIQNMIPQARIIVAHGQMSEIELENVMVDFMNYEYDILICTTIIESGLDISNVNTIIIENADHMGLSQLYQLRGRVGRSNRIAYAYITYQRDKILSEIAEKRLKTIKEFTEFGAGFKIAMRDLEIRGAGNILGSEQHGHMAMVGYDMYCRLLEESVRELKGVDIKPVKETSVELNTNAYIPSHYINNENQKYEIYKKMVNIDDMEELYLMEEELEDRFGDLPSSVINLIYISYIKSLANKMNIVRIVQKENKEIIFYFDNDGFISIEEIKEIFKLYQIKFSLNREKQTLLHFKVKSTGAKLILEIKELLEKISCLKKKDNQI